MLPAARTGDLERTFTARTGFTPATLVDQLLTAPPVTVVIPVYNGGAVVRECIDAVLTHTRPTVRIVAINDGSTDAETLEILEGLPDRVEVVHNDVNLGYTKTVNRGLTLADRDDVVLLNSDTIVGPLWLQRLRTTAYSRRSVAAVSAVSDNAGAYAMPLAGTANPWPTSSSTSDIARFVGTRVREFSVEAPSAHGFCMYLRRDAIDAVGGFDEENFPRGYGEENDWSFRALAAGMTVLMAPRVFVRHAQGASFGSESRKALIAQARGTVNALHPSYSALVRSWAASPAMTALRDEFAEIMIDSATRRAKPRTLYVIHHAGGGTPQTNLDLMHGLAHAQDAFLLVATPRSVSLFHRENGRLVELDSWKPEDPFTIRDDWRADYGAVVAAWLVEHSIELIHVRHLINQPIGTLPRVADMIGIPLILSTHDFYYICPSVHLLDVNLQLHERCVPGEGAPCLLPTGFTQGAPAVRDGWILIWQERNRRLFDVSDHVIATTSSAADFHLLNYPELASKLRVIEHGRDLDARWDPLRLDRPRRPGPLRVACPARWAPHKGTDYITRAAAITGAEVEWHIMGEKSDFIGDAGVVHGRYQRDTAREIFDQIDPDFIGLFSIFPETYSHTLTEAWALGIPVVATDRGAVADRIRDHGGGHLFDVDSPEDVAQFLLEAARTLRDDDERSTPRDSIRSVRSMASDYEALYASTREARTLPTVGYVMHGTAGSWPASGQVRLGRRFTTPALSDRFRFRGVDAHDLVHGVDTADYDAIIVQRDSLPAGLTEAFVERCATRGIPLIVEIDDDLFSEEARARLLEQSYEPARLDELAVLLRGADAVMTSTTDLAVRVELLTGSPAVVIENDIDERIWPDLEPLEAPHEPTVLYMGSETHHADLEILRPVFEDLRTSDGRRVRLEVAGVTTDDEAWFTRVAIPDDERHYSRFARFLRERRHRWTAAVAPLTPTSFNDAKSDLKILEYARLGLPVVASDYGPYTIHDVNGVTTVAADPGAWRAAILRLVEDDVERSVRRQTLADYVSRSRTLENGESNPRLVTLLTDVIERRTIVAESRDDLTPIHDRV